MMRNWLVIGRTENWETAFSQPVPIWGLKPRYQSEFTVLNIGDLLWFYATSPISGIIGVGRVKDKYIDRINLVWNNELSEKKVIWPLRFRIQVLKVISRDHWKSHNIKINDFNLIWQIGFQSLQEEHLPLLIQRAERVFGEIYETNFYGGATIAEPLIVKDQTEIYLGTPESKEPALTHRGVQQAIAEIGKLQFYHTQIEYPIELPGEKKNLDVVWKREIAGVPTLVFEVELSGVIERAITRLKFAYTRWNSRPRLVAPKELFKKINNIIYSEERFFSEQFKIYEPSQITRLLDKKRELKTLEQNLEIY